ncbi:hypothetical protein VFPPC_15721 [Pochonia chlamydosporia 170]|uniref:Uncharacterized protein n=1 Tax=Pochonia chlamydosporia 170 TaxID=1380566 RepID=A0A179FRN0_METCM|nr:hypothetical protein VFPPC_15721 [Pochonia chlamydosporia 170]OAQ67679.2 hypothetical protein VFPPC_15721 [Pochonia chlamydosporia 170]
MWRAEPSGFNQLRVDYTLYNSLQDMNEMIVRSLSWKCRWAEQLHRAWCRPVTASRLTTSPRQSCKWGTRCISSFNRVICSDQPNTWPHHFRQIASLLVHRAQLARAGCDDMQLNCWIFQITSPLCLMHSVQVPDVSESRLTCR